MSILQESAEVAMDWSNNNDMKINASKTHELLIDFSKDKVFSALPNITMSGVEIQRSLRLPVQRLWLKWWFSCFR